MTSIKPQRTQLKWANFNLLLSKIKCKTLTRKKSHEYVFFFSCTRLHFKVFQINNVFRLRIKLSCYHIQVEQERCGSRKPCLLQTFVFRNGQPLFSRQRLGMCAILPNSLAGTKNSCFISASKNLTLEKLLNLIFQQWQKNLEVNTYLHNIRDDAVEVM